MAQVVNKVRKGFYLDSVALMRMSQALAALPGVEDAALMMGSPANQQIMADAGLLAADGKAARGGDLVVAIRAEDQGAAEAALAEAERLLERPRVAAGASEAWRPRTIRSAVKTLPEANLAIVSVPGAFAAAEARKALRRGLHVMLFSDNVAIEDELALKQEARDLGRLLMGPDCGTAIINGVPLAFANRVPRGAIGIIGASGTGMQEISCLIAQGGAGISHAIGVGGRDLSEEIGGITTGMALDALDRDAGTQHVVLVSKPPAPSVAARLVDRIAQSSKSFTLCLLGTEAPSLPNNATFAPTLKTAAEQAIGGRAIGGESYDADDASAPRPGRIRGLYAGGSLCAEAQVILRAAGESVASNAPIPGVATVAANGARHQILDLGADEYTSGRPHPMIDPTVRDKPIADALADPETALVLLDVVIGLGAHGDPAGHLAAILADQPKGRPPVIASVTGVEDDPQVRSAQIATLKAAGVSIAPSNADAAERALALVRGTP